MSTRDVITALISMTTGIFPVLPYSLNPAPLMPRRTKAEKQKRKQQRRARRYNRV